MDKPLTHKAERTLKKKIQECNAAILRLDLNSTPTFPKDTRKYWLLAASVSVPRSATTNGSKPHSHTSL